tara:strand:- start:267 stop:671 length:405 start_codon:yes stop_codon:yes gene_type:complete
MKDNSDAPDYEKGDTGYVHHVKCDYCYKNVTPHILTMAIDVKTNTNNKACPECITKSSSHFFFNDNLLKEDGSVIDGVSPQHWLRLTHIDVFQSAKAKEVKDEEKDVEAGTISDEAPDVVMNEKKEGADDAYFT